MVNTIITEKGSESAMSSPPRSVIHADVVIVGGGLLGLATARVARPA
jgi:NADPH-dependent 2,4-dienoyl-CoA reductase/sulfur reductase-like enzyme